MLCKRKGVKIVEAEVCPDHVHMLVRIPPNISVSSFMGYLKGKSTLMIFERHANLKYKYGNRHFWCRGYYVDCEECPYGFLKKDYGESPFLKFLKDYGMKEDDEL